MSSRKTAKMSWKALGPVQQIEAQQQTSISAAGQTAHVGNDTQVTTGAVSHFLHLRNHIQIHSPVQDLAPRCPVLQKTLCLTFISKRTVFLMQARSKRRHKVFFSLQCFLALIVALTNDLQPRTFCFIGQRSSKGPITPFNSSSGAMSRGVVNFFSGEMGG